MRGRAHARRVGLPLFDDGQSPHGEAVLNAALRAPRRDRRAARRPEAVLAHLRRVAGAQQREHPGAGARRGHNSYDSASGGDASRVTESGFTSMAATYSVFTATQRSVGTRRHQTRRQASRYVCSFPCRRMNRTSVERPARAMARRVRANHETAERVADKNVPFSRSDVRQYR